MAEHERGNMKIYYIDAKGKHTIDGSKAIHGEVTDQKELRANRFRVSHDGTDLIFTEVECGLPNRLDSTKPKHGSAAEKPTSKATRSAKSASKKG